MSINNPEVILVPETVILPVANRTATFTSAAVVIPEDADTLMIMLNWGTITDGSWTPSLTHSATAGGSFTAVAATDISGTPAVGSSTNEEQTDVFTYKGPNGFVKVVMTETTASTLNVFGVTAIPVKGLRATTPS